MEKSINDNELTIYFDKHDTEILSIIFNIYDAKISEFHSYIGNYESFSHFIHHNNENYICSRDDIWELDILPLHIIAPKESELSKDIRLITYVFRIEDEPYIMYMLPDFVFKLKEYYPHYINAESLFNFINDTIDKPLNDNCSITYVRNTLVPYLKYLYIKRPKTIFYTNNKSDKHKRTFELGIHGMPCIEFARHMVEYYEDSFTRYGNTYYWIQRINNTPIVIRISKKIFDRLLAGELM